MAAGVARLAVPIVPIGHTSPGGRAASQDRRRPHPLRPFATKGPGYRQGRGLSGPAERGDFSPRHQVLGADFRGALQGKVSLGLFRSSRGLPVALAGADLPLEELVRATAVHMRPSRLPRRPPRNSERGGSPAVNHLAATRLRASDRASDATRKAA